MAGVTATAFILAAIALFILGFRTERDHAELVEQTGAGGSDSSSDNHGLPGSYGDR
jgi:hypothetical protein